MAEWLYVEVTLSKDGYSSSRRSEQIYGSMIFMTEEKPCTPAFSCFRRPSQDRSFCQHRRIIEHPERSDTRCGFSPARIVSEHCHRLFIEISEIRRRPHEEGPSHSGKSESTISPGWRLLVIQPLIPHLILSHSLIWHEPDH